MPKQMRSSIRHPGEIPWLIVAGVFWILNWVLFVVVAYASIDEGVQQWVDNLEGDPLWGEFLVAPLFQFYLLVLIFPLLAYVARALMYAQLRTSAVRMSPTQFPEAYRMVCEAALQMGLRRVPDAYVISGNGTINAFASGHAHRRFIAVYSDLFEVGGAARDPGALRFIIGHEVGHIAAGHTSYFRMIISSTMYQIPVLRGFLSRAQEYTSDNHGHYFAPDSGAGAMAVLAAGKYLNVNVGSHEFADRAASERGFWVWCANLLSSHPILTWRMHALRDRSKPGRLFLRPRTAVGLGSLPPAREETPLMPTPAEALAYLDANPPSGPPQFGANFPVPLPGSTLQQGDSAYGQGSLYHGWQDSRVGGVPNQGS